MKITNSVRLSCFLLALLLLSFGAIAAETATAETAEPNKTPDWFFHNIIDDLTSAP